MALNVSLDDVQGKLAAILDQDEDTSNISTADYSLRREIINMAQREWAETYDWKSLYRESNTVVSTSTGNASVAMPSDFRKLAGTPQITYDGVNTEYFQEIRPQERYMYANTDRYIYMLGDQNTGHIMFINSSTLASGASISLPYYRSPASLVSPADIAMCPNPEYLVQRSLAYVWETQADPRFPQAKQEADKILRQMLEYEQVYGEGYDNKVYTVERKDFNSFRWGKSS
jgi:hypothetical protein